MDFITELIAKIAVRATVLLPTTLLVTVVVCACAASLTLMLTWGPLKRERWARLLGFWFILLTLQYLPPTLETWKVGWALDRHPTLIQAVEMASKWARPILSPLNNLLLLGAAALLLRWPEHDGLASLLSRRVTFRWLSAIPLLGWVAANACLAFNVVLEDGFLRRLPDAIFSAFALWNLATAIYRNADPGRQELLSRLFLWGLRCFALTSFLFAFSPLVADGSRWLELRSEVESELHGWARAQPELDSLLLVRLPAKTGVAFEVDRNGSVIQSLDAGAFGLALIFKLVLLGGMVSLMRRSLIALSPRETSVARLSLLPDSQAFLSEHGFVRDLGIRMGADLVSLYSLVPGDSSSDTRAAAWYWMKRSEDQERVRKRGPIATVQRLRGEAQSVVTGVLLTGQEELSLDLHAKEDKRKYEGRFFDFIAGEPSIKDRGSFVLLPIRYHAATVGCLNVEWRTSQAFSETMLIELRESAELLAPVIQAQRELAAIHALTLRLRDLATSRDRLGDETLLVLLEEIVRFLNPAAAGIYLDHGFRRCVVQVSPRRSVRRVLSADTRDRRYLDELMKLAESECSSDARPLSEPIQDGAVRMGSLDLLPYSRRDWGQPPGMVSNELLRKTVGILIGEALRRIARRELDDTVSTLAQAVEHTEGLSHLVLSRYVQSSASIVGIEGALLEPGLTALDESHDSGAVSILVDRFKKEPGAFEELPCGEGGALSGVFCLRENQTQTLLRLELSGELRQEQGKSRSRLWLVVRRSGFGAEVEHRDSPWWQFLDDLGTTVGSALVRIERERLRYDAEEQRLMAVRVAMGGFAIHDVGNHAVKLGAGLQAIRFAKTLEEARQRAARLTDQIVEIERSASRIREPAVATTRVLSLPVALDDIKLRHGEGLAAAGIELRIDSPPKLQLRLGVEALSLVLDNLIANARREILADRERGGTGSQIQINVRVAKKQVLLDVIDDGPGLPAGKIETLFEFHGRSWGLPISRWVLLLYKCQLSHEDRKGARGAQFTIKIPHS